MAVNPSPVAIFAPGSKAHALQINGIFDASGAFLGLTATVEVTLPDGTKAGQFDFPISGLLDPAFLLQAQQVVPAAVRQLVANVGCEYG